MRRRAAPAALLLALVLGGCVYYPVVSDVGGVRIRPRNGRAVVQATGMTVYMDIDSTGTSGDALVGVTTDIAREAVVVVPPGTAAARLEVPGGTTVKLTPEGPHIVLSDLTRTVGAGETVLVTLLFEKFGRIGVPTRVE